MKTKYSEEFREMIADEERMKDLTWGSFVKITSNTDTVPYYEMWRKGREFIARAINKSGSVLDIGCANGFLLRCLMEWSEFELEPYGIDPEERLIKEARKLFPGKESNFVVGEVNELDKLKLPGEFDFIYWNVWDNWSLKDGKNIEVLMKVLERVRPGGRLVLGFYDEQEEAEKRINDLKNSGVSIDGRFVNPEDRGQVVWIQK